jgi:hypothetical protein
MLNGIGAGRDGTLPQWTIQHANQAAFAIVDGLPAGQLIGAYGTVEGEVLP